MTIPIDAGSTSQTIDVFIADSASSTGAGKTGLAYNTASIAAYYRKGATGTATAITLATQTVAGAYSSGGFVEIDATNMPGMYRLDLPNAVVDTAGLVHVLLKGATGMAPTPVRIDCRPVPVNIKQIAGQTASASGTVTFPNATLASTTNITAGTITTVTTVTNQLTAAAIATGVWQDATAGDFTVASSIGKSLYTGNVAPGAAGGHFIAGTNAATTVTTAFTTTFTGNLTGSVGSVTATVDANVVEIEGVAIDPADVPTAAEVADAVWDEVLSGHLTAGTTGNALSAAGAAGDPWSTALPGAYSAGTAGYIVGNRIDAAITSRLAPTTSGRTLDVTATGAAGIDWSNVENPTTTVGLSGTTVKTATDVETDTADIQARIPAALVSGRIDASVGAMAANVLTATAINADAFTAAKFAADVTTELQSGLATAASVTTIAGYLDTEVAAILAAVDTEVAAIKAVTDLLPDAGALSSLATAAALTTVDDFLDTEILAIKAKTDLIPAAFPGNFSALAITAAGKVTVGTNDDKTGYSLNLAQAVATSNTANTLGDCLNAARADGFGKWTLVGTTLTMFAPDGTTPVRTFTLDSVPTPSERV